MLARNHVFTLLAMENDRSPTALGAGFTIRSLQIAITSVIMCLSWSVRLLTAIKTSAIIVDDALETGCSHSLPCCTEFSQAWCWNAAVLIYESSKTGKKNVFPKLLGGGWSPPSPPRLRGPWYLFTIWIYFEFFSFSARLSSLFQGSSELLSPSVMRKREELWGQAVLLTIGIGTNTLSGVEFFTCTCDLLLALASQLIVFSQLKIQKPGEQFDWSIARVVGKPVMWLAVKTRAVIGYVNRAIIIIIIGNVILFPVCYINGRTGSSNSPMNRTPHKQQNHKIL